MGSKMLIDASQPEEIRVVVARGNKLEEFDFESASRKPLKGNIYLAKVTRVEPSLQAAFIEYGGNRHGFLAFAEIHPDYYQIPIADRMALLAEQEADEAEEDEDDEPENGHHDNALQNDPPDEPGSAEGEDTEFQNPDETTSRPMLAEHDVEDHIASDPVAELAPHDADQLPHERADTADIVEVDNDAEAQKIETIGEEDALEEVPQRRQRNNNRPRRRHYKIQEVIKRRQILLVQVIKEERGNKGAALTTYLSLAGRYCVLMPNTAKGGGISRKITDAGDRRRLKEVAKDVEVPKGMGVIVRTAGAQRTRPEIKRDFDYLMRLWESVRDLTLKSSAPCLVYEEGNLIKRSIRDLYTKDVDEIIVDGDASHREAKDFMKMLMPSHAKNVKLYKDPKPLFQRYQVEAPLDALYSPTVNLPSGGYLVINQTEALVSIDINSGRATREHNIEDTASKTNLEACDEIARQLRLRDLAGLVVIDYIDMEENRNNRAVERRLKEALKNDRARIQVGRISHFGLLEMSRQRLRPGLLEGSFKSCPHCEGRGIVRSVPSCGLGVLRQIEDHLQKARPEDLTVKCAREVAFYLLNEKRDSLLEIEQQYDISIFLVPGGDEMKAAVATIERAPDREKIKRRLLPSTPVQMESGFVSSEEDEAEDQSDAADEEAFDEPAEASSEEIVAENNGEGQQGRPEGGRRRRRRGRRGGNKDEPLNGHGSNAGQGSNAGHGFNAPRDGANDEAGEGEVVAVGSDGPAQFEQEVEFAFQEGEPTEVIATDAVATDMDGQPVGNGEARERGNNRGNRRGRFGRNRRGGREDGSPGETAPSAGQSGEQPEGRSRHRSNERGAGRGRDAGNHREHESMPTQADFAPAPVVINIPDVISDPEPRKWQPPAPTVATEPVARKGGWWSKK